MVDRVTSLRRIVAPAQEKTGKTAMTRSDSRHDDCLPNPKAHDTANKSEPIHPRHILFPSRYGPPSEAERDLRATATQSPQASKARLSDEHKQSHQPQSDERSDSVVDHPTLSDLVAASQSDFPPLQSVWSPIGTPVYQENSWAIKGTAFQREEPSTSGCGEVPPLWRFPPPCLHREFRMFGPKGWEYLWDDTITQAIQKTDEYLQDLFEPREAPELLSRFLDVPSNPKWKCLTVLEFYWSRKLYVEPDTPRPPILQSLPNWWNEMGFVGHMNSWPQQFERILQNQRDERSPQSQGFSASSTRL